MIIAPELELAKSNNTGGADMLAGDNVVYTLTVTAPTGEEENSDKYVVKEVKVVDLHQKALHTKVDHGQQPHL
jgi:hypothetical protein